MKKLYLALLFVLVAVVARAQVTYAPGGINYGHGMVVQETSGTGTPNPLTCSGFVRYWQTDASISPMWECLGGTMVNVGGGSTSGGTSFAVTTTATGLQNLSGPLQIPNVNVGSADTNIFRCGAACLAVGSTAGTVNGTFQAFSFTGNFDGVLVATNYSGSDIGAKANAAFASCTTTTSTCIVMIPSGTYSYTTSIVLPGTVTTGYTELDISPGAILNYTGSSYAIQTSTAPGGLQGHYVIRGGYVHGTSAAKGGVLIAPGVNGTVVEDMMINSFSSGDCILDVGTNAAQIKSNKIAGCIVGFHAFGTPGYASNNLLVEGNVFSSNTWGAIDGDITQWATPSPFPGFGGATTGVSSPMFGNVFIANDFESNAAGGAIEGFTTGSQYIGNYFEANPRGVVLGMTEQPLTSAQLSFLYGRTSVNGGTADGTSVAGNFFTTSSNMHSLVELRAAGNSNLTANATNGATTIPCFFDLYTGSNPWVGQNDQQNVSALLCQGGSPGWSLVNTIPVNTVIQGSLSAGTTSLGTLTQTGFAKLNSSVGITGGGVGAAVVQFGAIVIFSTSVAPSGSCTAGFVDIGTFGFAVCKNGTWAVQ